MHLRVMTYNIHKAIGADRMFRPDRIVAILKYYSPDIALLQEVDHGAPRSGHVYLATELAQKLHYDHQAFGINVFLKRGKYGNATLSRFPIGRQHNIDLSLRWRKRRGAQHTTIAIRKGGCEIDLEVFNVHLGLSAMERREQLRRLFTSEQFAHIQDQQPCLVAGDMNDWRGVLKRIYFTKNGFACATNRRTGSRWSIKTFPSYAPTAGLDKIFYRGRLKMLHVHRSRLKLAQVASDHLPVIAEFEL